MNEPDGAPARPTAPVALPRVASTRLVTSQVDVPEHVVDRLRAEGIDIETDATSLDEHGRDWWPLSIGWAVHDDAIPSRPSVVARPSNTEAVAALLRVADEHMIPVTPMAGRSGVCGAALPLHGGIALDMCAINGIVDVDDESLTMDVRAGTFGHVLEATLRADHRLTLGHSPQSIALSTVGGWLACRSAGQHSTRYGKIEDMVRGLEVVLADGTIIRTGGRAPREAAGPDLTQLFVGSEGTLGVVTSARLVVHPLPSFEAKRAYGFSSFSDGLEACRLILRAGATPAVLRLYDERESARSFGTGDPRSIDATNVLLVFDEGDEQLVAGIMQVVERVCSAARASHLDASLVDRWMSHRNDVSQLESVIRNDIVVDTIEVAAPWRALPGVHADVTHALKEIDGTIAATCHQSHAYADGACLYFTFAGRPATDLASREQYYARVWDVATSATLRRGGALSHHHGVGLHRGRFLRAALGPAAFGLLETVKRSLDPRGILNPGKLGLPDPWGEVAWP